MQKFISSNMLIGGLLGFSLVCLGSCEWPLSSRYITEISELPVELYAIYEGEKTCSDYLAYSPDLDYPEHTPMKHLRVNIHYMCTDEGERNFSYPAGEDYAIEILNQANLALENNRKMFLPINNETPVLPPRIRYQLVGDLNDEDVSGVYYHKDNDYHFLLKKGPRKNLYDRTVFSKYGMLKDTVLNIFSFGFPEDSIISPTFKRKDHGIAFRSWVKLANWYDNYLDTTWKKDGSFRISRGPKYTKSLLNHEIGHVLGLAHSWVRSDGCDDTPSHPNCWNYTKNGSKCDSLASNNVMDYNAYQSAYSPCQLGRIHYNFAKLTSRQRKLLDPRWCTQIHGNQQIIIQDSIVWNSSKDIEGDIIIKNGGSLTVRCRLSLPAGARISIEPGGVLVLHENLVHNSCGYDWMGIEVQKQRKKEGQVFRIGEVQIENVVNPINVIVENEKT